MKMQSRSHVHRLRMQVMVWIACAIKHYNLFNFDRKPRKFYSQTEDVVLSKRLCKKYSSFLPVPCPTRSRFLQNHLWPICFSHNWLYQSTAVLITLLQHLTDLVTQHDYVHLIALDFSKAFDTVRHSTLLSKIADLQIDDQILYNWLVDFFANRQHLTKHNQDL